MQKSADFKFTVFRIDKMRRPKTEAKGRQGFEEG
jgi:hypothetical protein